MIDHSVIQPNGYYGIQLYFRNREDFWKRIRARTMGFKRYNEEDKNITILRKKHIIRKFNRFVNIKRKFERVRFKGTFLQRFLLRVYFKIENYLMRKKVK